MRSCDWCSVAWNNEPCQLRATLPEGVDCDRRVMKGPGFENPGNLVWCEQHRRWHDPSTGCLYCNKPRVRRLKKEWRDAFAERHGE